MGDLLIVLFRDFVVEVGVSYFLVNYYFGL